MINKIEETWIYFWNGYNLSKFRTTNDGDGI